MKIGIMGGSFNPFHNGHLETALSVMKITGLDKIILMPANNPPHKEVDSDFAPSLHRYCMTVLGVIDSKSDLTVSDYEISKGGVSYTWDTMNEFTKKLSDEDQLYFITGVESFEKIETWREWEKLVSEFKFIINTREGYKTHEMFTRVPESVAKRCVLLKGKKADLDEAAEQGNIFIIYTTSVELSGTMIRGLIREGNPVEDYLNENVLKYLEMHNIYKEKN